MNQQYLQYKPIIDIHISKYRGSDVPEAVLRSKAKIILSDTLKSYSPDKGSFETYLNKNLMGLNRFVGSSMQIRMPELKQQQARTVMDTIYEQHGDDDNVDYTNIGKILGIKPKSIKAIYAGARRSIVSDPSVEDFVPVERNSPADKYNIEELYRNLPTQLHKDILDYSMGTHGKEEIKTNVQIAQRLGISESYVRKLKEEVLMKLRT